MIRDQVQALIDARCGRDEIVSAMTQGGYCPDSVRRVLRELAFDDGTPETPRRRGAKWTPEEDRDLKRLARQGLSGWQIGLRIGKSKSCVYERMNHLASVDAKRLAAVSRKVSVVREKREAEREAESMDLIDRRVRLFDVADGKTRQQIAWALMHEDPAWINDELAVMLKTVRGHPPILKLGRDGIYRAKEAKHATTQNAEPRRVKTGGRNRRVRVGA